MTSAEALIEICPDSSLSLLKTIENPEELKNPQRAEYFLLLTCTRDKCKQDIASDTLIYQSADYYEKKNDIRKSAWSQFYAGRVAYQNKESQKTNNYLVKARENALKLNDYNLLGLISYDLGFMFQKEFNFKQARTNYDLSQSYFLKSGNKKNAHYIYEAIGYLYVLEGMPKDSAFFYYRKALEYAIQQKDSTAASSILKGMGVASQESKDYHQSRIFLRQAMQLDNSGQFENSCYELLARTYLLESKYDSAFFYAEKLHSADSASHDAYYDQRYYSLLYEINKQAGRNADALKNYENLSANLDEMYADNMQNSVAEIREKYHAERIQNAYNKIIVHRQFLIIVIIIVILISIIVIRFFSNLVKKKNLNIMEAEDTLEMLNKMISEKNGIDNQFKSLLIEKLDIARRVAQMELAPTKDHNMFLKRYNAVFNKDLINVLDWENLYPVINDLYKGFIDKITAQYPGLSEKEMQMCCLIHAGFSINEIGFILSYTYESARVRKVDLRKKMGFETNAEFMEFLSQE